MSKGGNQLFGFHCRDVYQCILYIVDETYAPYFLNVENRLQFRLLLAEEHDRGGVVRTNSPARARVCHWQKRATS
jgi:hypothetical protein